MLDGQHQGREQFRYRFLNLRFQVRMTAQIIIHPLLKVVRAVGELHAEVIYIERPQCRLQTRNEFLYNMLIQGSIGPQAMRYWNELNNNPGLKPNEFSYFHIISSLDRSELPSIPSTMRSKGLDVGQMIYQRLLECCSKDDVISIVQDAIDHQCKLSWQSKINIARKMGRNRKRTFGIYKLLEKSNDHVPLNIYTNLIKFERDRSFGEEIVNFLEAQNRSPGAYLYETWLSKADYDDKRDIVLRMRERGLPESHRVHTILMERMSFADAKAQLLKMEENGPKPDAVTYDVVMNRAETFDDAREMFNRLKAAPDLLIDAKHYSALLRLASEQEAEAILSELTTAENGVQLNRFHLTVLSRNRSIDWATIRNSLEGFFEEGGGLDTNLVSSLIEQAPQYSSALQMYERFAEDQESNPQAYTTMLRRAYKDDEVESFLDSHEMTCSEFSSKEIRSMFGILRRRVGEDGDFCFPDGFWTDLLSEAENEGVEVSAIDAAALFRFCSEAQADTLIGLVSSEAPRLSLAVNSFLARLAKLDSASIKQRFTELIDGGFRPDFYTMSSLAQATPVGEILQQIDSLKREKVERLVDAALIEQLFRNSNSLDEWNAIDDLRRSESIELNVDMLNQQIRVGKFNTALEALDFLKGAGVAPNWKTFTILISEANPNQFHKILSEYRLHDFLPNRAFADLLFQRANAKDMKAVIEFCDEYQIRPSVEHLVSVSEDQKIEPSVRLWAIRLLYRMRCDVPHIVSWDMAQLPDAMMFKEWFHWFASHETGISKNMKRLLSRRLSGLRQKGSLRRLNKIKVVSES